MTNDNDFRDLAALGAFVMLALFGSVAALKIFN